ncbi:MAG: 4Fe-4S dicluster domain [Pseudonocardiales bacterium]|jgi:adenylylsulfate reductase subunit B|nr:4Fe-4S dicluster domain [Pseudonocardiales bacterium]
MPPQIAADLCTSCGICQDVCPGDILHLPADSALQVRYPHECSHCGICRTECPTGAIEIRFAWNMLQPPIALTGVEGTTDA